MQFDKPPVVIDNGSRFIKAGFAGDNHPVSMFRTLVGRPSYLNGTYGRAGYYDIYIGDEAESNDTGYELTSPIENGKIVQWDNMERIWHHIFYRELKAAPEDRAVILACAPTMTMADKIKCCQVFFEVLNSPAITVQSQNLLALYGSGVSTGVSVDMGYDSTNICPAYEGGFISYARINTGIAGRQICDFIDQSLLKRSIDLGPHRATYIDEIMKYLYVTPNVAMTRKHNRRWYTLFNGIPIDIGQEAFMAAEYIFQPQFISGVKSDLLSIYDGFIQCCMKCDGELRGELINGIVLSGGLSMIPGLSGRLQDELEERLKKPVNVLASTESYVTSWVGGATFAGLPDVDKVFVTRKQYEEYGAKIIKNKFIV